MTTRTDRNEVYENGSLVAEEVVEVDVTAEHNASAIDTAITSALTELRNLVNAPALPDVPAGTMTTAQLSSALRTLRNEAQATRAGAQRVADILLKTIRLVRGDFDGVD